MPAKDFSRGAPRSGQWVILDGKHVGIGCGPDLGHHGLRFGRDGEFRVVSSPPPGTVPACAEAGVMGALAGLMGSMMALEAIREIVGFGEGLVGRLLMVDARAMRFETLRYARDPQNPLNGDAPGITDLSGHR